MQNDHEIGRIVAVDTAQVTAELNRDLKALTRSTYEGTLEIGRINSYIIIPVGAIRIVAMVTRVMLTEESELKADKTMVTLPSSRRLMKATMIGTIDEGRFKQGISIFPVLDSPVLITTSKDLDSIFGKSIEKDTIDYDEPGFCIPVGTSSVFQDYTIKIDPDAFFGKHTAIIGSTGSGKSCTIASIIQSILFQKDIIQTRFIILDTNGEYRSAFQRQNTDKKWKNVVPQFKTLYIPTDPSEKDKLIIPYWFMDSEDFARLFRASPGVQRPVLLNALSSARNFSRKNNGVAHLRLEIINLCNIIRNHISAADKSDAKSIRQHCDGFLNYIQIDSIKKSIDILKNKFSLKSEIDKSFENIKQIVLEGIS